VNAKWTEINPDLNLYATHAFMIFTVAKHHGALNNDFNIEAAIKKLREIQREKEIKREKEKEEERKKEKEIKS
jgi:hypothetical protein